MKRAIAIGLVAEVAIIFLAARAEISERVFIIPWSIAIPALSLIALLVALNGVLVRCAPRLVLRPDEMMVIYVMVACSVVFAGSGMAQLLVPMLAGVRHFGGTEASWAGPVPHIPAWVVPRDGPALAGFYAGRASVPWGSWAICLVFWGGFMILLAAAMLCLAALVRRPWEEHERLTFPLVHLPQQMMFEPGSFFRSRAAWMGFGVVCALESLRAIHALVPAIPAVPLDIIDVGHWFATPPWNAVANIWICFYPLAIALGFLLPSSVSFTLWVFFWIWKSELVIGRALNLDGLPSSPRPDASRFPFIEEQAVGGCIGIGLIALWQAWRLLRRDPSGGRDARRALLGLVGCFVLLVGASAAFGAPPFLAAGVIVIYLLFCITAARLRAEAGTIWTSFPYDVTGDVVMARLVPSSWIGPGGLAGMALMNWFPVDLRNVPMPYHLDAFRLAGFSGVDWKRLVRPIAIASVIGVAVALVANLVAFYDLGALSARSRPDHWWVQFGRRPFDRAAMLASEPVGADWIATAAVAASTAITWLLFFLRSRFAWFPLHPVGMATLGGMTTSALWLPYFIAWLAKVVIARYGGANLYRRVMPFFLGVILGEAVTIMTWTLISWLFRLPFFAFLG
jgi:hypothetical protein